MSLGGFCTYLPAKTGITLIYLLGPWQNTYCKKTHLSNIYTFFCGLITMQITLSISKLKLRVSTSTCFNLVAIKCRMSSHTVCIWCFHLFSILYRTIGICTTLWNPAVSQILQVIVVRSYWYVYYCEGAANVQKKMINMINIRKNTSRCWFEQQLSHISCTYDNTLNCANGSLTLPT